jgi:hypothetical protein
MNRFSPSISNEFCLIERIQPVEGIQPSNRIESP